MCVEFEDSINKFVKVVQKDGFVKHGKLVDVTRGSITLLFSDGRTNSILRDFVSQMEVVE